jgi:hypothetical protein
MLQIEDLSVDLVDAEQDANDAFFGGRWSGDDSGENAAYVDIILILGQLDADEVKQGEARWTADQMLVIERAKEIVASWSE